jgi:hypothetical protein
MKNNKKGLSTIVATLLIILLTLVAVGIIWVVVKNVITGGAGQVTIDAKCLAANVVATKVVNATPEIFSVTLNRAGGDDQIGGVKLAFTNADESTSYVYDVPGNMVALSTITVPVNITTVTLPNPSKVSVVVYFLDDSGNAQLCSTANQLSF